MRGFAGRVWRLVVAGADPLAPAAAPVGRFHHDGQRALYASLTPEGAGVAMARYLGEGRARVLVGLEVRAAAIADLTVLEALPSAVAAAVSHCDPSMVWQPLVDAAQTSPVWAVSDAARAAGAQGMIYASRSRPELRHLVLFDWGPQAAAVRVAVAPRPWQGG